MADYRKDNASFMLYKNWKAIFDSLTNEDAGVLIKALFCFASGENLPNLEGLLSGVFSMMTQQMSVDGEKWERKCERNAENIRKRWNKNNTTEYDRIPTNTSDDTRNTNDTDKIREDKIRKDKISKDNNKSSNAEAFERIWKQYPKKQGRKEALAAFERAIKHGATVEEIENGIMRYKKHIADCKIDMQYVKQGSTYFRQESWNDVYDDAGKKPEEKTSYDIDRFEDFAITFSGNCK